MLLRLSLTYLCRRAVSRYLESSEALGLFKALWGGHARNWKIVMVGILDSVNQRTQLVGKNRLELLLFRLDTDQI